MDKYIKEIYKALRCNKAEKKRIINDLRSDIMIAIEEGESFEDIEERLGTPTDYAKEFNENLGIVKKSNKRLFIGLGCGLVLAIVCFIGYQYLTTPKTILLQDSKIFNAQEVFDLSDKAVSYLTNKDYTGLESMFSDVIKQNTSEEEIFGVYDQLGEIGSFKKISDRQFVEYKDKSGVAAVGDVVVEYEKRTIIYRLSFNEDLQIIGLYMR